MNKNRSEFQSTEVDPTVMELIAFEDEDDIRFARIAFVSAVVLHLFIFLMNWSFLAFGGDSEHPGKKERIHVLQLKNFRVPPKLDLKEIRKPKPVMMPVPDPQKPEPIREESPEEDFDFPLNDESFLAAPVGPIPPLPKMTGPVHFLHSKMGSPERIGGPDPCYTEPARRAGLQGTVVLECIIGREGSVGNIKVLRGLGLGLTENAVSVVRKWRFKPATLNGKPLEVIYVLTVRYRLN